MRLTKTCDSRSGSASTRTGRSAVSSSETPLFDACCSNDATIGRATSSRSTSRSAELDLSRLRARLFEQLPDERGQTIDLRERLRNEEVARLFLGRLEHRLEHQLDRRERRPQLVRDVREKLLARAIETRKRSLIVGEDRRRVAIERSPRSADRPRRDRFVGRGHRVSMSGATEASPRSASPMRRSSSMLGIALMTCSASARSGSKPKVAPAAALANSTWHAPSTSIDADRQRARRAARRRFRSRVPRRAPPCASALCGRRRDRGAPRVRAATANRLPRGRPPIASKRPFERRQALNM